MLFCYIGLRAYFVNFTFDEGFSFEILIGEYYPLFAANTHLLNTFLAFITSSILGYSEWALRLPNVLIFLVYAYFCYKIVLEKTTYLSIAFLALSFMLFNHFLVDYFGLMRGYGLAVAFFTGTIYYFLDLVKNFNTKTFLKGIICSALMIYANYSFFTPFIALHLALLLLTFTKERFKIFFRYFLIEFLLLLPGLVHMGIILGKDRIIIGGQDNFIKDTLYSIFDPSFSNILPNQQNLLITVLLSGIILIGLLVTYKNKPLSFILSTTLLCALIPTGLNLAIGMNFPQGRAALYWIPLIGITFYFILTVLFDQSSKWLSYATLGLTVIIIGISSVSFFKKINLDHTITWKREAKNLEILETFAEQTKSNETYNLGVDWIFYYSVKYYKLTKDYSWFKINVISNTADLENDFFYVTEEINNLKKGTCLEEIQKIETINTLFLKNCAK